MTTLRVENNVIFGTGPLGLSVMDELVARGRRVTLVSRSGEVKETLPAGVVVKRADATNPDEVAVVCAGADVVFHCAQPAYHEWPEKFPPITQGIVAGLQRLNKTGPEPRLVMGDNLYMYGPTDGKPIREELAYAATGRKGKCRAEMARYVLNAHQAGNIKATLGRGSDFFGPRVLDSAAGEMLFGAALRGKPVNVLGAPDLPHTLTYIGDFGRALVTLSEHEEAFGRAWHVPSAETVTIRRFAQLVGEEIGRPVKLRVANGLIVGTAGLFVPALREMKEMMYAFEEPYVVDDGDFRQAFGNGATPHAQAIRETVGWYRQRA